MARRRKEDGEAVSLFPFLSILACLIGSLTLMVMAVSLGAINEGESPEAQDRKEAVAEIDEQVLEDLERLEELKALLADAEDRLKTLEDAKAEIERLKEERAEEAESAGEFADELAEINRLRERITELEMDVPGLDEEIANLKKQVADAGKPKEAEVVVRPGGSGVDMEPTFVEVRAGDVVINDGPEPKVVRRGDLNRKGGEFHALVEKVAATPKGIIIFLLREDGIGTFGTAKYVCRTHYGPAGYAKYGKLPIVGQGKIDLSLFRGE